MQSVVFVGHSTCRRFQGKADVAVEGDAGELTWRRRWKNGGMPRTFVKVYVAKEKPGWWGEPPLKDDGAWRPPVNFRVPSIVSVGYYRGYFDVLLLRIQQWDR